MNGCPKNKITGKPETTGLDRCEYTNKYDYIGIRRGKWEIVGHRICDRCGLDISVFDDEREKETAEIQAKKTA